MSVINSHYNPVLNNPKSNTDSWYNYAASRKKRRTKFSSNENKKNLKNDLNDKKEDNNSSGLAQSNGFSSDCDVNATKVEPSDFLSKFLKTTIIQTKEYESDFPSLDESAKMSEKQLRGLLVRQKSPLEQSTNIVSEEITNLVSNPESKPLVIEENKINPVPVYETNSPDQLPQFLKFYEKENLIYHSTSVFTEELFDLILVDLDEMHSMSNNCQASQYDLVPLFNILDEFFNVYRIANDVNDFSVFARHYFAFPEHYVTQSLCLPPGLLISALSSSQQMYQINNDLVHRVQPLALEERIFLHYNKLASHYPSLREDRIKVISELLEYYFSDSGLPLSDHIGRSILESQLAGFGPRMAIFEVPWQNKLMRLRVTPQEVHQALSNSSIVRIIENAYVELVNPIKQDTINQIMTYGSDVHSVDSNASPDPWFNRNGVWRPPSAITSEEPPSPPRVSSSSIMNALILPLSTSLVANCSSSSTISTIVSNNSQSLTVTGGEKPRTRNPSTVSVLGDENVHPDDILLCFDEDLDWRGVLPSSIDAGVGGATRRKSISERILAKHPSGDRHSNVHSKSRPRNTKRGNKREAKEAISLVLNYDWSLIDDDMEYEENLDIRLQNLNSDNHARSASVDSGASSQTSQISQEMIAASVQTHPPPAPPPLLPPLQIPILIQQQTGSSLILNGDTSNSSDPNGHLGYQQRINPILPPDFLNFILPLGQFICPSHQLTRPDLLPIIASNGTFDLVAALIQQSQAAAINAQVLNIQEQTDNSQEFTSVLRRLKTCITEEASTTTKILPETSDTSININAGTELITTTIDSPKNIKLSNSLRNATLSPGISSLVKSTNNTVHPLMIDQPKSKVKLNDQPAGVFTYQPRTRTKSGSVLENVAYQYDDRARRLYYDELLQKGTKERTEKGVGKSQWMNLFYNVARGILIHRFNRLIYNTFRRYALEDDAMGVRYGIQCLFYFYSYSLEIKFRQDLYMDFEHLVSDDLRNGKWYGYEKFWAFFTFSGKQPNSLVKDNSLFYYLKHFNSKEKIRAKMEIPSSFKLDSLV